MNSLLTHALYLGISTTFFEFFEKEQIKVFKKQIISKKEGDFLSDRKFNEQEKRVFRKFADKHAPSSPLGKDCLIAFVVGGLICLVGQCIYEYYNYLLGDVAAKPLTSVTLIFLSCLFTGLGLYDSLAKHAGAGTLVPITGFANAVCSPAIDSKAEGYILGVASKMFVIAGPVIVYGTVVSVIYGIIYYIMGLF